MKHGTHSKRLGIRRKSQAAVILWLIGTLKPTQARGFVGVGRLQPPHAILP